MKGEVAAHDAVIFSKTYCPYCKKVEVRGALGSLPLGNIVATNISFENITVTI